MSEPKCCCWRPGWLGHHHDDSNCEFLREERDRERERGERERAQLEVAEGKETSK